MAECPLPKPNTRVRFPSPAPKGKMPLWHLFFFWSRWRALRNCARATRARGEFAKQICAILTFYKNILIALHFLKIYAIINLSLMIPMEER